MIVSGHHDWFNVFQRWEDFVIDEVIKDAGVIEAVQDARGAQSGAERFDAVKRLVEKIG